METLGLDHILFVPVGDHPFKHDKTRNGINPRVEMLQLAIGGNERFSVSTVDIDRPGPHYSADTVEIIQRQYPNSSLYFVMGGDNLRSLPAWARAEDLYRNCRLAVMKRADENISATMHDTILPGLSAQVDIIDVPLLSIWLSSTHVVERIAQGKSVRYLVPDAVLDYIQQFGMYKNV